MLPKKSVQHATNGRQRARLPLPGVRRQIWEAVCEMIGDGDPVDLAGIANRFRTSERIIAACLAVEGMKHERVANALRNGMVSTLQLAREAGETLDVMHNVA